MPLEYNKYTGACYRAVLEMEYAKRKLNGDPDIVGLNDAESVRKAIEQGEYAENWLRERGYWKLLSKAKLRGHDVIPIFDENK